MSISPYEPKTDGSHKVLSLDDLGRLADRARADGLKIVQSHGVFDLLHPGHVDYLQRARALGDLLVVSVTSDREVRRGPGRPVFSEDVRIRSLAALECVDYVVLSDAETGLGVIEVLRPSVYVKGREYADPARDLAGNFASESARVREHGGDVRLVGEAVYNSTQLLNDYFGALSPAARAFAADFRRRWDHAAIRGILDTLASIHVLVVGEAIVDEYITCEVQGVTPKERVPSVRPISVRRYWGGSYAIARHLATICGSVTLAGIAAPDDELAAAGVPAGASPLVERELTLDPAASTVLKQRYVVENRLRSELTKVFAVSNLPDLAALAPDTRRAFMRRLTKLVAGVDLVVVADYGHGLLDQAAMDLLQDCAPQLAVNCQTNSANTGFNLITKYRRADTFTLDLNELMLAFRHRTEDPAPLLAALRAQLDGRQGWLTLGSAGAIACDQEGVHEVPALTLHTRDTLGAGDAFFAWASASAAAGQPLEIGSFLGSVAGAVATNITGNERAVEKMDVLRFAATILNV